MEVPPLKQKAPNTANNERINNFKILINNMDWEQVATNVSVKVCPLASTLCDLENSNAFYYDDIHFDHHLGVPFLKNQLLSYILPTSKGVIMQRLRIANNTFQNWNGYKYPQRNNTPYRFNKYEQSYHYMNLACKNFNLAMTCTYHECRMLKALFAFVLLHYMLVCKLIYIQVNVIGKTPAIANIGSSTYELKFFCLINYISTHKSFVSSNSFQIIKLELVRDGGI